MTKKVNDDERVRKPKSAKGTRSQTMFNFRCDLENYEYLQGQVNKGRFLNELIRKDREEKGCR